MRLYTFIQVLFQKILEKKNLFVDINIRQLEINDIVLEAGVT